MADTFRITKLAAARRQLRVAIQLLFNNSDPVAVHTLVGAASVVISYLAEQKHPERSWDKFAQDANGLSPQKFYSVMRAQQNFLKHAEKDADVEFNFDPSDTESIAFWCVMNLTGLGELSMAESVFQAWYLACHAPDLDKDIDIYRKIKSIFGDLRSAPRANRIEVGRRVLESSDAADSEVTI